MPSLGGNCGDLEYEWTKQAQMIVTFGLSGTDTSSYDSQMQDLNDQLLADCKRDANTFMPCRTYYDTYKKVRDGQEHWKGADMFLVELQACIEYPSSQGSNLS